MPRLSRVICSKQIVADTVTHYLSAGFNIKVPFDSNLSEGTSSVRIDRVGGWSPHLILPTPYLWSKFDPGGSSFNPHLSFADAGMLLDSHFFLMQFLKYPPRDDLNVNTILVHIED